MMIKFKVEVNPFKRKVVINSTIGNIKYTKILYYFNYINEKQSFEIGGEKFNIKFSYTTEFLVSIYSDKEDNNDVELIFKLTD